MKGQDEIKKALSLCPGDSLECEQDGCPYWDIRLCVPELHIDALDLLKEQETVVRCKDCIYYRYYGLTEDTVSECTIDHCVNQDKEWFCADGERKEGR